MPSRQGINFLGFNVVRIGSGPWCTLHKPKNVLSITVGDPIAVDVDSRLFANSALPAAGTLLDAGVFTLRVAAGKAQLSADPSVWAFADGGVRTALVGAFDTFVQKAEGLETTVLRPGVAEILRDMLAQRLPLTYAEALYIVNGVFSRADTAQTWFDVRPGTRLRIDFAQSQFVPPNLGAAALSGFVGGPTVTADVVSLPSPSGSPKLGVDAFLSAVRLPATGVTQNGFADVVDLSATLATPGLRHVRFCYPAKSFPRPDSGGNLSPAFNVAVLGADDLATLSKATAAYYKGGDAGAQLLGYFRGRAVVQPLIPVVIDSIRHFVPVGTTARQLRAPIPRIPGYVDQVASRSLIQRRRAGLDLRPPSDSDCDPVVVADGGLDPNGADALDWPVVACDRFTSPPPSSP